jgi:hypothetical protein
MCVGLADKVFDLKTNLNLHDDEISLQIDSRRVIAEEENSPNNREGILYYFK